MKPEALEQLIGGLRGKAITAGDDGYDEARRLWNGTVNKKPALIVKCEGAADVIDAVAFARSEGLGVSIRGGGHHVAGGAVLDGGVVVDLSAMRSVRVDPAAGTVRAEGGALIGDVDRESTAFGLLVPLGLFSRTGIAGITLAGGLGWVRRKYGMTCDNLVSADVVTADGRLVKASAGENSDLFWALRGGGWDMGVVTSFEYQAQPVAPEVFFTFVAYALSDAKRVLQGFRDYMGSAPDEASPIAVIWTFPEESEEYPAEVLGKQFVAIVGPYAGQADEGERAMQPLRELATPLLDISGAMPYLATQHLFDQEYPDGRRYYWKSSYLDGLDDGAIDRLIDLGGRRPSQLSSLDIWSLGGMLSRVGAQETPIGHRHASYMVGIEANWENAGDDAANIAWARETAQALTPHSTGGSYLNFEDLTEAGAAANSHGANFDRLVSIKRKYDPDNLFRSGRSLEHRTA